MNTENSNTNDDDASGLTSGTFVPAELVEIADKVDALGASHRAELSTAALVAMARATRPNAGGLLHDHQPLRFAGEPIAAVAGNGASGWLSHGRVLGGLLAMAASVALMVAIWPAASGGKSGGELITTTGGVDAAMQIASNVDDKLSLDEGNALLAEADAIGMLSLDTDGKNAS